MESGTPLLRGFVVLVVDDDADSLATAAALIELLGCSVLRAASGSEALSILDSGAHVDLLFSDVVMPKGDGLALARAVREHRPGLPVVLATGHAGIVDAVSAGGAIPLIKPYSVDRLEAVLAEQLHVPRDPPR
jgi:DNA-binding NtrC family response regulator